MQKSVDLFVYLQFLTTLFQGRMQKSVNCCLTTMFQGRMQ